MPDEPVEIVFEENTRARIRLVDCVGYTVLVQRAMLMRMVQG